MNQSNFPCDSNQTYFPKESNDYVFEIPAQATYIHKPKNPSGWTPIETIQVEGIAYRRVSSGRSPWWVIFVLCFLFGIPIFTMVLPLFVSLIPIVGLDIIGIFPYIIGCLIFILILWRGIRAKLWPR